MYLTNYHRRVGIRFLGRTSLYIGWEAQIMHSRCGMIRRYPPSIRLSEIMPEERILEILDEASASTILYQSDECSYERVVVKY